LQLAQSTLENITYKSGKMQYANKKDFISSRGEKNLPVNKMKLFIYIFKVFLSEGSIS